MPNTKYRAGRDLEYAAAKDLEANGYIAIRAAGSHGLADLIALKYGELLFVQCKTDGKMTARERDRLTVLAGLLPGAVPLIARWEATGPRGGRTVAYARIDYQAAPRPWTPDYAMKVTP